MKRLFLIGLLLFSVSGVQAVDLVWSIVDTIAADSSDSGYTYDTAIVKEWPVSHWKKVGTNFELYNVGELDTNFSVDLFAVQWQTSLARGSAGVWRSVPGAAAVDSILPKTNDTLRYGTKIIVGDTLWNFIRAVVVKRDSLLPANSASLAGNIYTTFGRVHLMKKE